MPTSPALPSESLLAPDANGLARATQLIRDGKLVVLPTETVYGIGLNLLSAEARAAARQIKAGRAGAATAPWVIHVGKPEDVLAWAPHVSKIGARLISKALPGPVAFQIKLSDADLA